MLLQGDGGGGGLGRTRREGTDSIRSLKGNSANGKRDPNGKLSGGLVCFICVYLFSCLIGCCSYSGEMGEITEWGWRIYLKQREQEHGPQLRAGEEETGAQGSTRNKEGRNKGQRWGPGRERQSREGR